VDPRLGTSESSWRLYVEDTEQMYSKHLRVHFMFRHTTHYFI